MELHFVSALYQEGALQSTDLVPVTEDQTQGLQAPLG